MTKQRDEILKVSEVIAERIDDVPQREFAYLRDTNGEPVRRIQLSSLRIWYSAYQSDPFSLKTIMTKAIKKEIVRQPDMTDQEYYDLVHRERGGNVVQRGDGKWVKPGSSDDDGTRK